MDKTEVKALAIGRFDGFHRGHIKLFDRLGEKGAILVIESAKIRLISIRERLTNISIFYYQLDDIRNFNGTEFIEFLLKDFPNLKRIVVGYDFKFGKDRICDANDLESLFNGEVIIIDECVHSGLSVHTRVIREFLNNGDVKMANELLGRNFEIYAKVIKGQGLGSKELFATLNLEPNNEQFYPKDGVYATRTKINNKSYNSVTFIGNRVSTDDKFSIETHILDSFDGLPKELSVEFIDFIRENKKFYNLSDLKNQISKDISKVVEILNER